MLFILHIVCLPICVTKVSDLIHENGIWGNRLDPCWLRQYHETPQENVSVGIVPSDTHLKGQKPFWSKPKCSFSLWKCSRGNVFFFSTTFNWTFWGVSVGEDASDTTILYNIVTISSRREGALLCIHTSRDQCSEHSRVKWRFSLHKESFFLSELTQRLSVQWAWRWTSTALCWGSAGRQTGERQTGWIRETGRSSGQRMRWAQECPARSTAANRARSVHAAHKYPSTPPLRTSSSSGQNPAWEFWCPHYAEWHCLLCETVRLGSPLLFRWNWFIE